MDKTMTIDGIPFEIRTSGRARRLRMSVGEGSGIRVTVPRLTPRLTLEHFIRSNTSWAKKQLGRIERENAVHPPHRFRPGETFYYLGEPLVLTVKPHKLKRPRVRHGNTFLTVFLDQSITRAGAPKAIREAIETAYKKKAAEIVFDRLEHFNRHYGFTYRRVFFRNQKSRWGSCSAQKNLNFNWRLVMAPIEVIDYVVVHELCHLKEMNHSKAYWQLVAETVPEHKTARHWLRKNAYLLRW